MKDTQTQKIWNLRTYKLRLCGAKQTQFSIGNAKQCRDLQLRQMFLLFSPVNKAVTRQRAVLQLTRNENTINTCNQNKISVDCNNSPYNRTHALLCYLQDVWFLQRTLSLPLTNTKTSVNTKLRTLLNILINCCYIGEENIPPIEPYNTAEAVLVYALTSCVGNERKLKQDLTLISHGVLTVKRTFETAPSPKSVRFIFTAK